MTHADLGARARVPGALLPWRTIGRMVDDPFETHAVAEKQGVLLYRLVELGYLTQTQVDDLMHRLVRERCLKATAYLDFAPRLDAEVALHQPHIMSRCYYAMYHAARACVLHLRRADVDDHARLPRVLSQMLGTQQGAMLGKWREVRHQVDYAPYAPADLGALAQAALDDAAALLTACRNALRNRGMHQ